MASSRRKYIYFKRRLFKGRAVKGRWEEEYSVHAFSRQSDIEYQISVSQGEDGRVIQGWRQYITYPIGGASDERISSVSFKDLPLEWRQVMGSADRRFVALQLFWSCLAGLFVAVLGAIAVMLVKGGAWSDLLVWHDADTIFALSFCALLATFAYANKPSIVSVPRAQESALEPEIRSGSSSPAE